jgi:hypothetical protein
MKYNLLFFATILLFIRAASGQLVPDPVADFLSRHADPQTGELFPGESWTGATNSQPPGGYLLRFEAPIGLHGSPVLFIAASILSDMRSSMWTAYTYTRGRGYTYTPQPDDLGFSSNPKFYLLTPKINGFLGLAEFYASRNGFAVFAYRIDKSGHLQESNLGDIKRDQDREDSDPKFEDKETARLLARFKLSHEFNPHIEKILLEEYLKNPTAKWRPFNPTFGVDSQNADPADKDAISHADLDQTEAYTILKARHSLQ